MIDHAEAMTVIDVNTGKFVGSSGLEDTVARLNLEAVGEIVNQLRLRDVGGIIVIDFIDMVSQENRERVVTALKEALSHDRAKNNVVGFTGLGHVGDDAQEGIPFIARPAHAPLPRMPRRGLGIHAGRYGAPRADGRARPRLRL